MTSRSIFSRSGVVALATLLLVAICVHSNTQLASARDPEVIATYHQAGKSSSSEKPMRTGPTDSAHALAPWPMPVLAMLALVGVAKIMRLGHM